MQHSFDIEIAKEYGILEAILLNHIYYWIAKNKANKKHFYNGKYWTYNSRKAFSELFPYASEKQIRRVLERLVNFNILMTGNFNKQWSDRTLWYAFTDKGLSIMQKSQMQLPEMANDNCLNGQMTNALEGTPIPDINTNIKPDIKPCKREYGEFKNVLLTDDEYKKLENINALSQIENLSRYIASTGKRYKSHYATILNWDRREKQQEEKDKYKGLSFREQELLRQEEITKQWLEEG